MPFEIKDLKEHNSELLKLLTQHLPDMLWVKDLNGIYLYANQSICDGLLMAKDTDEPIGKNDVFFALREREAHKESPDWHTFGELCFNSDQVVIDNNKAMKFEEYGNVKGELLYLEVYKAPFYDKDENIIGTVGAGRDITKLKKIQLDLEESLKILDQQREQLKSFNVNLEKRVKEEIEKQQNQERLMIHQSRQAAMGEMVESIAHQWRQPLNIIGLATANLETQYTLGLMSEQEFHEKMEIVSLNINYMSETIDDFRNFLNPEREMISFSPQKSIEDVLTILNAQLKSNKIIHTLTVNCDIFFYGVENEFKQVMFILLNNAVDAIKINIEEKNIEQGNITITLSCKNNQGIIEVYDNGNGIDADIIDSIFDPYFTTKYHSHGVGIGLYIAKNIIETRMKGALSVQNIKSGSCFTISLPLISDRF
ncbi:PAS/PAC sensor signal transduction histidine kinase [Sulfurimonas gotlandica GD1]|uniref:histidine kinase n=1 Tax=Sulfurimonas gotlandica (strain DSM 19862 / JCM 16533 / GD1) TaxID=929558 RepID=B6BII9_SULGG|nr:PAS domain-containing sensor histidine kinase [Sulfurimonas gotlandica]EDZ63099.1 PAS/PAC sensor signal transduction histidine kinase [Sulfurimonas gotlandica GD1]EHP30344.1 PAS/PAC sensor signal transduction histidine kinase [Sulfurimonas gotlandica GD1]